MGVPHLENQAGEGYLLGAVGAPAHQGVHDECRAADNQRVPNNDYGEVTPVDS